MAALLSQPLIQNLLSQVRVSMTVADRTGLTPVLTLENDSTIKFSISTTPGLSCSNSRRSNRGNYPRSSGESILISEVLANIMIPDQTDHPCLTDWKTSITKQLSSLAR